MRSLLILLTLFSISCCQQASESEFLYKEGDFVKIPGKNCLVVLKVNTCNCKENISYELGYTNNRGLLVSFTAKQSDMTLCEKPVVDSSLFLEDAENEGTDVVEQTDPMTNN